MTRNGLLSASTFKEARAIAPMWLLCLVAIVATVIPRFPLRGAAMLVYALGSIGLGVWSMGHEFSGRTLTLFLSQPRSRARQFLLKLIVLALALLTLAAAARIAASVSVNAQLSPLFGLDDADLVFPLLCGLFIAPCLTMLCRSPLAGMVFTVTIPLVTLLISEWSGSVVVVWQSMFAVSAIAAVFSWRLFLRLEAIDGHGASVDRLSVPSASTLDATTGSAGHRPLWRLAKKELRLQQLSFAVAGIYVVLWLGIVSVKWRTIGAAGALLDALTIITVGAISLLAGSLASAEERELGTIEWHALLPMSGSAQWAMKAGIAMVVSLTVGLGLPALLSSIMRSAAFSTPAPTHPPLISAIVIAFLTVVSLYVSSLCTSGLRALMWSLLAGLAPLAIVSPRGSFRILYYRVFDAGYGVIVRDLGARVAAMLIVLDLFPVALYVGVLALLLRFASANHRSSDRGARRIWNQSLRLGAFVALVMCLWFGVSRAFTAEMERHPARTLSMLTGVAVDEANKPVESYTLVLIPHLDTTSTPRSSRVLRVQQGTFKIGMLPGRYSVVAVRKLEGSVRDPRTLQRLLPRATPVSIAGGESKTLTLTLSPEN
jgi:hypothetical protein